MKSSLKNRHMLIRTDPLKVKLLVRSCNLWRKVGCYRKDFKRFFVWHQYWNPSRQERIEHNIWMEE